MRQSHTAHPPPTPPQAAEAATAAPESLSEYMQKVRHLSVNARPLSKNEAAETLETRDPAIAAALLLASSQPTAERYRDLAEGYRERGVLDAAYRNFNRAIALNPRDGAAYEGLARVWRDWGFPELALGDAHRAVYYAPRSGSARNTYGTIMQALGQYDYARAAYEAASRLEPQAAYAVNNLCYLAFVEGRLDTAIETCRKALEIDPTMTAARNNLALAFAATGRIDLAARGVRGRRRSRKRALQQRHRLSCRRRLPQRAGCVRPGQQGAADISTRARARAADTGTDVPGQPAGASEWHRRRTRATERRLFQRRPMITIAESSDVVPFPAAAQTLEASGLTVDLILQLTLKSLHFAGELTGTDLSRRLGLEFPVIAPALELLKGQHQIAIVGGGFVGGASYRYRITDAGRTRAALFLETSHYVGAAPVPARAVPGVHERLPRGSPTRRHARARASGVFAPRDQRRCPRSARAGDQRRTLDVRLRPSGERQDGHLGSHPQPARRRDRDPARARSRGQHRPALRSGES